MLRPVRQSELLRARADRRRQLRMQVSEASAVAADAAWDELSGTLLEFISRRVRRREDAEDVLQEVMLRIHRHGSDVISDEAVTGWIYWIARNAIIDHYRRASTRHENGCSSIAAWFASQTSVTSGPRVPSGRSRASTRHETSVGDAMEDGESVLARLDEDDSSSTDFREELSRCLAPLARRLPASYRDALVVTEFEGVSQVDAAHALGLSVSGMKSRVQRGREKLKAMLLDCCEVELDRRGSITDYRSRSGDCGCS